MSEPDRPWSVPVKVEDVPEEGLTLHLSAEPAMRAKIAQLGGLTGVARLEADFEVMRRGRGVAVTGTVSATVGQTCVVTLEPMESEIAEPIDLAFSPAAAAGAPVDAAAEAAPAGHDAEAPEPPEPLRNGIVDLGAIATEFLLLGIDPYPRKPGAVFEAPDAGPPEPGPFAALAALKAKGGPERE